MVKLRSRMLRAGFQLLYGPLVFLHEPIGRFIWGQAWPDRRLHLLSFLREGDCILDVGCGQGQLLRSLVDQGFAAAGLEPSASMRRRSANPEVEIRTGVAQRIPWPDNSFDVVIATYPGNWILDPAVWTEFRRITVASGHCFVLLGGDYRRGPYSKLRSAVLHLIYPETGAPVSSPIAECQLTTIEDRWGTCQLLICDLN